MLVEFDFAVTQMAYVKAAMDQIASFRPDGESPAQVQARIDSGTPVRSTYVTQKTAIGEARALRHATIDAVHEACVDFAEQGRSRFRRNPKIVELFDGLPVRDQTFQETLVRGDSAVAVWTILPPVGTPPAGAGLWGQLDLAGNVWEWNQDWSAGYVTPCANCAYLTAASSRVIRGGILTGARGRTPVDVRAAAEAASALSRVAAAHPEIAEIEINPLLVMPVGAVGLDAGIVLG